MHSRNIPVFKKVSSNITKLTLKTQKLISKLFGFRTEEKQTTGKSSADQTAKEYRILQVLGCLLNDVIQKVWLTWLIIATILCLSLSTSMVIQRMHTMSGSTEDVLITLVFSVIAIDYVMLLVFLVGGMAQLMMQSQELRCSWQKYMAKSVYTSTKHKRWERRFLKSCTNIKVRFGEINYIESETPLSCIDFSTDLTVQFLILSQ